MTSLDALTHIQSAFTAMENFRLNSNIECKDLFVNDFPDSMNCVWTVEWHQEQGGRETDEHTAAAP